MSGTIRCKHGYYMTVLKEEGDLVTISPDHEHNRTNFRAEQCQHEIPLTAYKNILSGMNATHIFLKDDAELKQFKEDHKDALRFIGSSVGQMPNGLHHLVF